MPNPNPSPATRFDASKQPADRGRTPTKFLREILDRPFSSCEFGADFRHVAKLKDESIREALVMRTVQIAFTDRVVVIGWDRENECPIERVSSAECLKAIQMLQHYDQGKPVESHELTGKGGSPLASGVMMVPMFGAGTVEDWEQASKVKTTDDKEGDKP